MSDHAEAISNLLGYQTDESYMKYEPVLNLYDTNNTNYNDGRITYDTQTLMNSWIDFHNGYIEPEMRITGTFLSGADLTLAIKNGIYQLISAIQLKINDIDIINNDNLPPYNSFRMYLTGDKEWEQTHGQLYAFAMDTINTNDVNELVFSGANVTGLNANYNEGFDKRVEIFNLTRTGGSTSATEYTFVPRIPLKMTHPYFEALDRPLINARSQLTLTMSGINGNRFNPLLINQSGGVGGNTTISSLSVTKSKLVVYKCEFQPETAIKINQNLAKGMIVDTKFWQAKHYKGTAASNLSEQDFTISTGIRAPRRVVVMFQNSADWSSNISCIPAVTDARDYLDESNLEINNERVYPINIKGHYEHYKLLQREMFSGEDQNSNGCLIPYVDFLKGNYRYYVYNIANNKYIVKDPNASVQLRFIGKKAGALAVELQCYVEHECNVTLNMTTGETRKSGD